MPHSPNASTPGRFYRFVLCAFTTLALFAGFSLAEAQDSLPSWTNSSGKTIQAEFIRLDGETLVIRMNGKEFNVTLDKLSAESQKQAKELAEKPSESLPEGSMSKSSRDGNSGADTLKLSENELKFIKLCKANRSKIKSLGLAGNLASFARDMTVDGFRQYYLNDFNKPRTPRFHLEAVISKLDTIEEYRREGKLDEETRNSFLASAATEMSFQMIAKHGSDLDSALENKTEQDYHIALSKLNDEMRSVFGEAKDPVVDLETLREKEQELLQLLKNNKDLDWLFRTSHRQFSQATEMTDEDFASYFDGEFTEEQRLPNVFHSRYLDSTDEYFRRVENAKSHERKMKIIASSAPSVVYQSFCLRRCRIAGKSFPFSEKRYEEQLSRLIAYIKEFSGAKVAEADKYVHNRSPKLDAAWERELARVKREMQASGFMRQLTKVAVVRVKLEDEDTNEKAVLGQEGLCFPRITGRGFAWGIGESVRSGEFVTVALLPPHPENTPSKESSPVLKVSSLNHYSAETKIDFTEGEVVCGGEILLKSVPKESFGKLIVRCVPESGYSLGSSGAIYIASSKFQLGVGGICKTDIAPGTYTVRQGTDSVGRSLLLQGPALENVVVRSNETTEVELKLYQPRMVEFEWCYRNPKESLEWQRGTSQVKTGTFWSESSWGWARGFPISIWDGRNCTITAANTNSFVRSSEKELPTEDGAPLPSQPAAESSERELEVTLPVEQGSVYECRYDGRVGDLEILFKVKSVKPVPIEQLNDEDNDKYVLKRTPTLDADWETELARVKQKMSEKGWPSFLKKVAVVRVRLENEDQEKEILLGGEGLRFPGRAYSAKLRSGEFVTVASVSRDGELPVLKVAGLKHYSAATKLEFTEGQVVCGGDILLKSIPEQSMGHLNVRCISESGTSIDVGSVGIMPDGFNFMVTSFQIGDDGEVKADIAPGVYTVLQGRDLKLQGSALEEIAVRPNETTEVEFQLYRPRDIELEWCYRNYKESLVWQRGTSRVKTGGFWAESSWGQHRGFRLSSWDGDNCTIDPINHTSFVRSRKKELPVDGAEPLVGNRRTLAQGEPIAAVKGAVFECLYGDLEIVFKVKSIKPVED